MAKFLVVDDDRDLVYQLEKFLTENGHNVIAKAFDGKQAIEIYSKLVREHHDQPEIVLMDCQMPELNGLYALKEILAIEPSCKVIMISADHRVEERAIDYGAVLFIQKPISSQKLAGIINQLMIS